MIENRITGIQNFLNSEQAALITEEATRLYLTGFKSSAGIVFITKQEAYFLTDFRYFEAAKKSSPQYKNILLQNIARQVNELIKRHGITEIYCETSRMDMQRYKHYGEMLTADLSDSNSLDTLLNKMRSVKTADETENIRKAQILTDKAFLHFLDTVSAGKTEKQVMLETEFYMRKMGSEGVAFDFIVVSGKNTSLPHGVPSDKVIEKGDFVTIDFGAVVNGYCSDMTRTVAVGSVTKEQRQVYETVLAAQTAALSAIKPGVVCKDVDKIARDLIDNAGYKDCFGHGLGHSVGIEIHENPSFNTRDTTVLEKGMVLTVEPGIYLENKFGVRIEDMVIITENGMEDITASEKELIIV